ncbi:MAG: TerB N-terminal domain-containing protein [Leptospirales bacterium]
MGFFIFLSAIVIIIFVKRAKKSSNQKKNVRVRYTDEGKSYLSDSSIFNTGYSSYKRQAAKTTFYGECTSISVNGLLLVSPFVYVSSDSPHKTSALPHIIFEKSKIIQSDAEVQLHYWPSYSDIQGEARYQLLKWLSDGKNSADLNIGLLFIYFYNLEYRAIKEGKDLLPILKELIRLYNLFSFNGSFCGYAGALIGYIIFALPIEEVTPNIKSTVMDIIKSSTNYSTLKTSGINFYLNKQTVPTKENLLEYVISQPRSKNSVIPDKVGQIFKDYFIELTIRKIPDIMDNFTLQKCDLNYHWASSAGYAERDKIIKGMNPVMPSKHRNRLIKLWDKCIEDFRPYSRKINKGTEVELFDLLPSDAKDILPNKLANNLHSFFNDNKNTPVTISDFLESINSEEKLTLNFSKRLSRIVNDIGYAIEPDVSHTNRSYKTDDFIVLFEKSGELKNSSDYFTATLIFDLGMMISQADDEIHIKEVDTIENFVISNLCKNNIAKNRISKRRLLATTGKLNFSGVAKSIATRLKPKDIEPIAEYLYSVAAADGKILYAEIKAIRKIVKGFGLSQSFIDTIETKLGIAEPITSAILQSKSGVRKKGSAIPPKPNIAPEVTVNINVKKLEQLKIETSAVQNTLKNVFTEDEAEVEAIITQEIKQEAANDVTVLETKFLPFYNHIITEEAWEKPALRKIALEHGFMVDEAIESINEWSDENLGDFLVVEKDKYHVSLELLK